MGEGIIASTTIRQTLFQFGYYPDRFLHPAVFISYRRLRFEDLLTGMRASLDWDIRSTLIAPHLNRQEGYLPML